MGARLSYNLIGTQKLISKFLQGACSVEELCLDESPTPEQEFRSQ